MKKSFHSIDLKNSITDKDQPILFIANHISWWDGIWVLHLNQKLFKRKFHFMMLEKQLRKNWFLNHVGGFSINPKSKTIIESINYTVKLLSKKNNAVVLFPQGSIQSIHKQKFNFHKGTEKILTQISNPVQIIFVANIIDYFSESKPSVFINIKEYTGKHSTSAIQENYNSFYSECIQEQIKIES